MTQKLPLSLQKYKRSEETTKMDNLDEMNKFLKIYYIIYSVNFY